MTSEEAAALLNQRIPAAMAIQMLDALDTTRHHVLGVDGFVETDAGLEARLDLILDVSERMHHLTWAEKAQFVRIFVANRAQDGVVFEVCAETAN